MNYIDNLSVDGVNYNLKDTGSTRFDEAQSLTEKQKTLARSNIGAISTEDMIDVDNTLTQIGEAADAAAVGAALSGKIDGAYVDDEGYLVLTIDGAPAGERLGPFIGSGGGGGSSGNNAVMEMNKVTDWTVKTIAENGSCPVSFNWSSTENGVPTGNGTLSIMVNKVVKNNIEIPQGIVDVDVSEYLATGSNQIVLTVSDLYANFRTIRVTVNVISLSISSTFDNSTPYTGAINFPYTPVGNVSKTVHFLLDDVEIGKTVTSVNGHQQSFTIPQQNHGSHTFDVYLEATVNDQVVKSNTLHYELICIDPLDTTPIIVSNFSRTEAEQYETLNIEYTVYDPMNLEAAVSILVNGSEVTTGTVDRTVQTFSTRADVPGTLNIVIRTGSVSRSFTLTINESEIVLEPVTDRLELRLSAAGRSNTETNRNVWESNVNGNKVAVQFNNVNWTSDGWQLDENGETCFRLQGGSSMLIPWKLFETDFVQDGKTFEIEFKTHDVMDYGATVVSCIDENRGFEIKPDNVQFKSTRGNIGTRFAADTKIRLAFVAEARNTTPLMYLYIDGEIQGVVKYTTGSGSFAQPTPQGILIGSDDCGIDIYDVYGYGRSLTMDEMLDNFIATRQDIVEMLTLYRQNNIKSGGKVSIDLLKVAMPNLPYFICVGPQSPQYKGDKKTVVFDLWDTASNVQRILHDEGLSINVQGTSSQYYAVKNWIIKLSDGATLNGVAILGFSIHDGEIAVNEFTLKADVASSESANNIVIAKLFNDLSKAVGILTPPQKKNSAVRVGVDGFPCVNFWNYNDGDEFIGEYNFNNDKGTFATFGFTEGDQAWDIRSNTSQLSKFHTATFPPDWATEHYEAIYPDKYTGDELMKPMHEWMYSTYQDEATDEELEEPITYDGVTYTNDTAAYRLAKFKAEFPDWYDLDNQLFYYLFTEYFLMVDSRQKNEHIVYWHEIQKWWDMIWDCDTALGTDNRGKMSFEYWMEDTDFVDNEAVYNGYDNVKWVNMRMAYPDKLAAMAQKMISTGMLDPDYLINLFKNWQAAWCKRLNNEDTYYKHIRPFIDDGDEQYLPMAYGKKLWQRNEFIPWRYRYFCSKYNVGVAMDTIMFRPYYEVTEAERAAGAVDITVELYKKCYVTVVWDSILKGGRVAGDTLSMQIENPLSYANDAVCAARNAEMIKAIHGLEKLKCGYFDSAKATNLQEVVLGSSEEGYENTSTKEVAVGANKKLKKVDLSNCVGFGTKDQKTLTLTQCPNIREVYLGGTKAYGVELPNGGVLDKLVIPETTQSIILRSHPRLTDENLTVEGYSNVNQLWLENMTGLDTLALLRKVPANTAVRITGFYWECADAAAIENILDLFDSMRGIDIDGRGQGVEVDIAQMSGTLHTSSLTGTQIEEWREKYPNYSSVSIVADHTETTLTLKTWDGSSTVKVISCVDGVPQESIPTPPSRTATAQYTYTAVGWSLNTDSQNADSSCVTNVNENRTVYGAYSRTVRTYTVTFAKQPADGGGTLHTVDNVPYGGSATYTGATPTTTKGSATEYPFEGWSPSPTNIQGNTTCYAVFGAPLEVAEIEDSWPEIISKIEAGTATYKVGNYKELDLGEQGKVRMQIVGKNTDPLASGDGNAATSWVSMELLKDTHRMNPDIASNYKYPDVPSWTASGNTWTSQNRYNVSTAKATWTLTATSDGTISIFYKTSNSNSNRNKITTLTVNGNEVASNYTNTTGATETVEVTTGDTVTVYCEFDLLNATYNYYGTVTFSSTGTFTVDADVQDAPKRELDYYSTGTGAIGSYDDTEMDTYLEGTIKPLIPEEVRSHIKAVTKYTKNMDIHGTAVNNVATTEEVWIPSGREVFGGTSYETTGPVYTVVFHDSV